MPRPAPHTWVEAEEGLYVPIHVPVSSPCTWEFGLGRLMKSCVGIVLAVGLGVVCIVLSTVCSCRNCQGFPYEF